MELIGIKFEDVRNEYEVIEFIEKFDMYRLKNYTTNKDNELMKRDSIINYIDNKESILKRKEKSRKRLEEIEKLELIQKEKELKELNNYNNDYGFTKNKNDLQRGKILKILNKKVIFDSKVISRKDLIVKLINNRKCTLKEVLLTNRYSSKKINLEYRKLKDKLEFRLYFEKGKFLELTKTEYEFANYIKSMF